MIDDPELECVQIENGFVIRHSESHHVYTEPAATEAEAWNVFSELATTVGKGLIALLQASASNRIQIGFKSKQDD